MAPPPTAAVPSGAPAPAVLAARLQGVGLHLPSRVRSTAELLAMRSRPLEIDVERVTGVRTRRVCEGDEDSYSLAVGAARDCLRSSGRHGEDVDLVIGSGISRLRSDLAFQFEPPLSAAVQAAIGARHAKRFDVGNACAGMLTGLRVAQSFLRRGAARRALIVSGEFVSNIGANAVRDMRSIRSPQMASLTVGDAGAAILVEAGEPEDRAGSGLAVVEACELTTLADFDRLCIGGPRRRGPGAAMYTDARAIHEAAIEHIVPVIERTLARSRLRIEDIDHVVPHQTTRPALRMGSRAIGRALGLRRLPRVAELVGDFGNTASTTHFLVLHELLRSGALRAGERVMLLAMASGLVLGVVILRMGDAAAGAAE